MRKLKMAVVTLVLLAVLALPGARLVKLSTGYGWSLQSAVVFAEDCTSSTSCGGH